ncbi:UDP-N-acetylmuramate--L-alanine ligase [Weissella viridescens]|uniref:UDP-N-acetylmuramate--L-alanine ligase n=1 Tax=Weissella viridescens TaxID=1629 RepID=A0A380P1P2_WEIVI|nr:UDP-N-acetylmuramate--L-alanine ligase [Weissella viridescens]
MTNIDLIILIITQVLTTFVQLLKNWLTRQEGRFAWGDDPQLRQLHLDVPIYYYGTNPETDDFMQPILNALPKVQPLMHTIMMNS